MKVEKTECLLKRVNNEKLTAISDDDISNLLKELDTPRMFEEQDVRSTTSVMSESPFVGLRPPVSSQGYGFSTHSFPTGIPRTPCVGLYTGPFMAPVMETPRSSMLYCVASMSTPRMSSAWPGTPFLNTPYLDGFKTPWAVPGLATPTQRIDRFSELQLSTPALFPGNEPFGVPDILEMIDDKNSYSQIRMEQSLRSYDVASVTDENVADFLLDLGECIKPPQSPSAKIMVLPAHQCGSHFKQLPESMENDIKEGQRTNDALKRKTKQTTRQKCKKSFIKEQNSEGVRRRVKRGGRCTRSLVRACKEVGLAENEEEVEALLAKHSRNYDEE